MQQQPNEIQLKTSDRCSCTARQEAARDLKSLEVRDCACANVGPSAREGEGEGVQGQQHLVALSGTAALLTD